MPVLRLLVLAALTAGPLLVAAPPASADGTRADVNVYLDEVADRATEPGVYVDPAVFEDDLLTGDQVTTLTRQARRAPGPLRIIVLPAERLTVDDGGRTAAGLAYGPRQLVREIHERVGRPGTYAVLVVAPSEDEGQSLYAAQWPGGGSAYDIRDATDQALSCCAPDYAPMLQRFVREADDRLPRGAAAKGGTAGGGGFSSEGDAGEQASSGADGPGVWAFAAILGLALAMLGLGAWSQLRRGGRGAQRLDDDSATTLRTALSEEIDEVRHRLDGLGPVSSDGDAAEAHAGSMRRLLDQASSRLRELRTSTDAQSVARTLADARYEYAAATALRDGRPRPARTPPCFVDPRHGLSVATMPYGPAELSSPVPVCAACRAELEAGQEPRPRLLNLHGSWVEHWRAGAPAWVYLHGYWAGQPFMHEHFSMPPSGWATTPAPAAAAAASPQATADGDVPRG